jgi:tRNA A-37 threonylcarbamoyl transferase component Bud32
MKTEKLLKLGAEARLTVNGNVLTKQRIKKGYRLKQIDEPLRSQRTVREANLMQRAKRAKVDVPNILKIDKKNCLIEMDLIKGKRIDLCLTSENAEKTGKSVGRLHEAGIIHGDLTTSNILVKIGQRRSGAAGQRSPSRFHASTPTRTQIYFIDFGLGEVSDSVEKRGVDIRVFKESINATKPDQLSSLMKAFWKGYKSECSESEKVINRLEQIEKRGRYKKR